jgi:hypothetical protein
MQTRHRYVTTVNIEYGLTVRLTPEEAAAVHRGFLDTVAKYLGGVPGSPLLSPMPELSRDVAEGGVYMYADAELTNVSGSTWDTDAAAEARAGVGPDPRHRLRLYYVSNGHGVAGTWVTDTEEIEEGV